MNPSRVNKPSSAAVVESGEVHLVIVAGDVEG
jgi:ribosomal protein L7Ae-like RNA K-turn-binding protein